MARIYYCEKCKSTVEFKKDENEICKCGYIFNMKNYSIGDYINMRTTWSGQTQVEFRQTTMDKDIAERNNR